MTKNAHKNFDFWSAQDSANKWTRLYVVLFALGTALVALLAEIAFRSVTGIAEGFPIIGVAFALITLLVSGQHYFGLKSQGGAFVAKSQGGIKIQPEVQDFQLKQLHNSVEEMALAAGVTMPEVFVIPSPAINAFAAGLSEKTAAVAVTSGALQALSRDELQGVIAHELGHIKNRDMVMNVRLGVLVAGFFAVMYCGMQVLRMPRVLYSNGRGGSPHIFIGLLLIAAGSLSWFIGSALKAAVSRQREYYADARAVQFTRSTDGLRGALVKILQESTQAMPATGAPYSHLYLDNRLMLGGMFSTHPPLKSRIARLSQGKQDIIEKLENDHLSSAQIER